jgi:hypothetical protein
VDGSLDKADRDELRRILDRRARPPCARQQSKQKCKE